jgi:predicted kinase
MSKLIIITGFLATLKSTVARKLSKDLNILTINKDDLKEMLGDTIGFTNRQENLKLSEASFAFIKMISEKEISLGHDLIIESNFKNKELDELKSLLDKLDCKVLTLFHQGDVDVLHERYLKRNPSRHEVHKATGLIAYDDFKKYISDYRKENYIGQLKIVVTTVFKEEDYQDLLSYVKDFINQS